MNDSEIFDFDIFTFSLTRSTIISELGSLYTVSNILSKNSDET
jgi:antitoxin component HigA of HigAB toxin-antitoxin module